MTFALFVPLCYLLGAIPFGLLVARIFRGVDVREHGSGNTGVANVLRTVGVLPALIALVLDAGKGALAVLAAKLIDPSPSLEVAAGLAALTGHNWSVFLRFRGGRGTATGVGALCAISPLVGLLVLAASLPFIAISRYVSLGSVIGAVLALVFMLPLALLAPSLPLGVASPVYILYPLIGSPMLLFKHRENIGRLIRGQERKLGETAGLKSPSPEGRS